jgi:hypothetical protein
MGAGHRAEKSHIGNRGPWAFTESKTAAPRRGGTSPTDGRSATTLLKFAGLRRTAEIAAARER